jgi:signal transduction histidine kinase
MFPSKQYFFILIFGLLFFNSTSAQQKGNSSDIKTAKDLWKIAQNKPDSVLPIANKLIKESQKTGNKRIEAYAYKARAIAWGGGKTSYSKSIPDIMRAVKLFEQLHQEDEILDLYIVLSIWYSNNIQFVKSAECLQKADVLSQKLNSQQGKAAVKRQMGILYRVQGQYDLAIPYFKESLSTMKSLKDTLSFVDTSVSLSKVYLFKLQPEKSLPILQEALIMLGDRKGVETTKGGLLEEFGNIYYELKQYSKSLEYYNKAYKIYFDANKTGDVAFESILIGRSYSGLKKYNEAEKYLISGYRISDSLKQRTYVLDAAGELSDMYRSQNDWKKAYQWTMIKDSVQSILDAANQNQKVADLQAKYEAEKKEKEITLLKRDKKISQDIAQKQMMMISFGIIGGILILLIIALLLNQYRIIQKIKRRKEIEKVRNTIAQDLHDEIGSTLSGINIISKVAIENSSNEPEKIREWFDRIHKYSGIVLENISDIVWTLDPAGKTLDKTISKMQEFTTDIFEPSDIAYELTVEGDVQNIKLDFQTKKNFYLIFKEAVNNAMKYSKCSQVKVSVKINEGLLNLEIQDNGIGFSRSEIYEGNGLKNMEARAEQAGGTLAIVSTPHIGTSIKFQLKIT